MLIEQIFSGIYSSSIVIEGGRPKSAIFLNCVLKMKEKKDYALNYRDVLRINLPN